MTSSNVPVGLLELEPYLKQPVCKPCAIILSKPQTAIRHMVSAHNCNGLTAKCITEKIMTVAGKGVNSAVLLKRRQYEAAPDAVDGDSGENVLPALQGVKVYEGYQCSKCFYCTTSLRYLRLHMEAKHGSTCNGDAESVISEVEKKGKVLLQTLKFGNKRKFFRVHPANNFGEAPRVSDVCEKSLSTSHLLKEDEIDNGNETWKDYQKFFDTQPSSINGYDVEECGTETPEIVNDFISRVKVNSILKDLDIDLPRASRLSGQSGTRSNFEKELALLVSQYLKQVPCLLADAAPALLECLYPKDDRSFQSLTNKSIQRYSRVLGLFLISAYRCAAEGRVEEPLRSQLQNLCTDLADISNIEERLSSIHFILKRLCLVRREMTAGVKNLFVRLFFACSCIQCHTRSEGETYQFREAHECSHTLAAMQNFIISAAVIEILSNVSDSSDSSAESDDVISDSRGTGPKWDAREQKTTLLLDVKGNTAMAYVRITLNICMSVCSSRTADVSLEPCGDHIYCGFVRGTEISLPKIGNVIRILQKKAQQVMEHDLLLGGSYPADFENMLCAIRDNAWETRSGYSFLSHESCKSITTKWPAFVLDQIHKHGNEYRKLTEKIPSCGSWPPSVLGETVQLGDTELRIYLKGAQLWLSACQEVQELLLVCMHLSSGSPARATEIATMRLQNGVLGQRSIYVYCGKIVTVLRYSKMRSQHGKDKEILRVPDDRTGYLLRMYILLFRKLEALIVGSLFGQERKLSHMEWLFVIRGERFTPERVRQVVSSALKASGIPVCIRDIRDFSSEMVRSIARLNVETINEIVEGFEQAGHEQARRSVETADRNYGLTELDHNGLGRRQIDRYRMFAREWHKAVFHSERIDTTVVKHRPKDKQLGDFSDMLERSEMNTIEAITRKCFSEAFKNFKLPSGSAALLGSLEDSAYRGQEWQAKK